MRSSYYYWFCDPIVIASILITDILKEAICHCWIVRKLHVLRGCQRLRMNPKLMFTSRIWINTLNLMDVVRRDCFVQVPASREEKQCLKKKKKDQGGEL